MRNNIIKTLPILLVLVLLSLLDSNAFGQYSKDGSYSEGYGYHGTMGLDPDEIMKYGQYMMRYGFHEAGMSGGLTKYPGYNSNLSDETIKKLNAEQLSFIRTTEDLRQTIYEKELYLKAEMVKKAADRVIALNIQNSLSEARSKFEQMMIEHLIRMKKINVEAESK